MTLETERQTLVKYHAQQDPVERMAKNRGARPQHRRPAAARAGVHPGRGLMALVEIGRFDRNLANIIVGRLESEGIPAVAFDGASSIADGSWLLIPVRVMVDEEDADVAQAMLDRLPDFRATVRTCTKIDAA